MVLYQDHFIPIKDDLAQHTTLLEHLKQLRGIFESRQEEPESRQAIIVDVWKACLDITLELLSHGPDVALERAQFFLLWDHSEAMEPRLTCMDQLLAAYSLAHSRDETTSMFTEFWPQYRHLFLKEDPRDVLVERLMNTMLGIWGSPRNAALVLQDLLIETQGTAAEMFLVLYGVKGNMDAVKRGYYEIAAQGISIANNIRLFVLRVFLKNKALTDAKALYDDVTKLAMSDEEKQSIVSLCSEFAFDQPTVGEVLDVKAQARKQTLEEFKQANASTAVLDLIAIWRAAESTGLLKPSETWLKEHDIVAFGNILERNSRLQVGRKRFLHAEELAGVWEGLLKALDASLAYTPQAERPIPLFQLRYLMAKGDLMAVRNALLKITPSESLRSPDVALCLEQLFVITLVTHGVDDAFEHLLFLWHIVEPHFREATSKEHRHKYGPTQTLVESICSSLNAVTKPEGVIAAVTRTFQREADAISIFFWVYEAKRNPDRALDLLNALLIQGKQLAPSIWFALTTLLIKEKYYGSARAILNLCRENSKSKEPENKELRLSLRLASLQGNVEMANEAFAELERRRSASYIDRRRIIHVYAENGDIENTINRFEQFYPNGRGASGEDYREVILAYVRGRKLSGVHEWVAKMLRSGASMTVDVYNHILTAFAMEDDLESAMKLLNQMIEYGVEPDRISYTTVLSIMADRKDVVNAERLYKAAVDRGVMPDDVMTMALMDAHVEAGSWRGVIQVFDHLSLTSPTRPKRRATRLYDTLLKAYINIGAPFNTVMTFFELYKKLGLRPTVHTYTMTIQSACDAGYMDVARDIFDELDTHFVENPGTTPKAPHIDAYLMTVLMSGYIRNDEPEMAKAVYEEMLKRGIQPRAATFGIIIHSFARERTEQSLRIAEEFMRNLTKGETDLALLASARGGLPRALESIYSPLMDIYGREMDVATVERLFDQLLEMGGQPTIILLCILMDAYRRVASLEGVREIWKDAVALAQRLHNSLNEDRLLKPIAMRGEKDLIDETRGKKAPYMRASLAAPLSIYIEALSTAGEFIEIANVWKQVREFGMTFDGHNWNHLAVALVRAGEVERAFEIVERVLIPWEMHMSMLRRTRRKENESPLFFVEDFKGAEEGEKALTGALKGAGMEGRRQRLMSPTEAAMKEKVAKEGAARKVAEALGLRAEVNFVHAEHREEVKKPEEQEGEGEEEPQQEQPPQMGIQRRHQTQRQTSKQENFGLYTRFNPIDPAQQLYEIQQMSPSVQGWRTHARTYDMLGWAMECLASGKLVRVQSQSDMVHERDVGFLISEDEQIEAELTLRRVYSQYPLAVRGLAAHNKWKEERERRQVRNEVQSGVIGRQAVPAERDTGGFGEGVLTGYREEGGEAEEGGSSRPRWVVEDQVEEEEHVAEKEQ